MSKTLVQVLFWDALAFFLLGVTHAAGGYWWTAGHGVLIALGALTAWVTLFANVEKAAQLATTQRLALIRSRAFKVYDYVTLVLFWGWFALIGAWPALVVASLALSAQVITRPKFYRKCKAEYYRRLYKTGVLHRVINNW